MRIAVIGAGVVGLAAAVGLQGDGHEVAVWEQREDPNPKGAGLTLFRNALEAFDVLGLGAEVRRASSGAIASMRAGQRTPNGKWLLTAPNATASSIRTIHRRDLHRLLIDRLDGGTLHTRARATVRSDGAARIHVAGGELSCDLVVVADGIRSGNRRLLGYDTPLRYAGCTVWRGVTDHPVDLRGEAGETWGRGRIFGLVPLPGGRVYWFASMNLPEGCIFPDEHASVTGLFEDWHDPIPECIAATRPEQVMRHDIHDLAAPLSSFVRGRTVLLGDAAHAMTPNLGQGAGQGIEDAATLTHLLRGVSPDEIDGRLARYRMLREKRTRTIQQRSRTATRIAQASHPVSVRSRDLLMRLMPGRLFGRLSSRMQVWPNPAE